MSELTKKSFLNFLASLVKTGGILALTFILTPILIKLLGTKDFGTFRVLNEIYSYLSLAEMGLMTAVITCMLPLVKSKNREQLTRLMAHGSWRFYKVVLWTVGVGICIFPFLEKLTSWDSAAPTELYFSFAILLFSSITIPSNIYKAYLEAQNKGYLVHLIIFFQNTIFTLLSVLFAYQGLGLKSQAIGLLISVIFGAWLMRYFSDIKVDLSKRNYEEGHLVSKRQLSQVLNELAGKLCWQIDQVVIASMIDTTMVTKVFIGQRVATIMQQQLLSLGQASWASLSTLYYSNEGTERFDKRFYEMSKLLSFTAMILLVPVCLLNRSFITLWVGKDLLMDTDTLIFLASANAILHGVFSFWGYIITVLGKADLLTKPFWIQAIINVSASILGTYYFGGIGPLFGTLISFLIVPLLFYPKILEINFKLKLAALYKSLFFPLVIGLLVLVAFLKSGINFVDLSVTEFVLKGILTLFVTTFVLFFVVFSKDEKSLLIKRVRTLRSKGKS
ncbi:MAG: lipopolysaccharide biosynthesis protein [Bacteriovoracaceae bacterium]|nr:lipopolysaccharide biosynthesis protein [Bacteriovoracaceae bacterium]